MTTQASTDAMHKFLSGDSSYQTTGSWCAGRDAWKAAVKWAAEQQETAELAELELLHDERDEHEAAAEDALQQLVHVEGDLRAAEEEHAALCAERDTLASEVQRIKGRLRAAHTASANRWANGSPCLCKDCA